MTKFVRFGEEFLDRIRGEVELVELIGRDLQLKKAGKNFLACCPFHEEKSASFTVAPARNTYRCFGCGAAGDAIEWMRTRHHMSFPDAVAHLAAQCGIPVPESSSDSQSDPMQRHRLAGIYQVLKEAAQSFVHGLEKSQSARQYLELKRGLDASTIKRFEVGVVEKGVADLLSQSNSAEVIVASGLAFARDLGIADRFRYRIMFPIHTESGALIGFAGRSMIEKPMKAPKYLNCPETEIFHKGRELYGLHLAKPSIRAASLAVIVEGYFDVLSLHQAGETRAVAPMGTAFGNLQAKRLLAHCNTVVFAFDGDAAGRKAARAAAGAMLDEIKDGKMARFIFLPDGEDPDTFVRAHGLAAWLAAIEESQPLSAFLVDLVTHNLDRNLPESQVEAAARAKWIISRIQRAELFRRAMTSKFEEVIGVPLH